MVEFCSPHCSINVEGAENTVKIGIKRILTMKGLVMFANQILKGSLTGFIQEFENSMSDNCKSTNAFVNLQRPL